MVALPSEHWEKDMATVVGPATGGSGTDVDGETDGPTTPDAIDTGRRWPPTLSAVVGLAVTAWGLMLGLAPLDDNSFLTHLATGRLILDGGIPHADPYSYTAAGQPWVVQSWLASLLYGIADDVAGGTTLRLLMGALTAAIAACVWRLTRPTPTRPTTTRPTTTRPTTTRPTTTLLPRIAIAALAVGVGTEAWSERPLLFGLLFLGVLLLAADDAIDPRWALPMMWVWVNVHGSFPLGLVAVALLALGRRLDGGSPRSELRLLGWAIAGTLLGAVGPLGPRVLVFPLELLAKQDTLHYITEWKSPTFDTIGQRLFLLQLAVAVLLLVRRPSYRAALPLVVFTVAALMGLRNIPVASIVMVPGMAAGAAGLGSLDGSRRSGATAAAGLVVGALTALLLVGQLGRANFELESYPVEAVAWLDHQGLLDTDSRLVSRDFVGNYLEALEGTDVQVFMDDRYDMFPAAVSEDYVDLVRGLDPGPVLERHDAQVVLWDRSTPLAAWLAEADDWGVVYHDDDWLVACRRPEPDAPAACPS